jgi:membrane-associated phospholipid phosphatase
VWNPAPATPPTRLGKPHHGAPAGSVATRLSNLAFRPGSNERGRSPIGKSPNGDGDLRPLRRVASDGPTRSAASLPSRDRSAVSRRSLVRAASPGTVGVRRLVPSRRVVFRVLKWVLVAAAPLVIVQSIQTWDRPLLAYIVQNRSGALLEVAAVVGWLGNPLPYALVAAVAFLFFKGAWPDKVKENRAIFTLVAATAPAILTDLLKVFFARSGPDLYLEHGIYEFRFFHNAPDFASFPSEPATVVAALASALTVLFPAYRMTFFLLAGLVAACPMVLGAHYLSDVLAGFLMGVCFVAMLRAGFKRFGIPLSTERRRLSPP